LLLFLADCCLKFVDRNLLHDEFADILK
jgi:hypothetical protein